MSSLAASLASLPEAERAAVLAGFSPEQAQELLYDWRFWGRASQQPPPGDWQFWLIMAGRGFGKTRTGAEWIRMRVMAGAKRIGLAGATAPDIRDVMVEGDSGILSVFPQHQRPRYEPSKRRITFRTGAVAILLSADEPERFRGPQYDTVWADELAAWRYPESWDQMKMGLRLGNDPRGVITTTPKPVPHIRELVAEEGVVISRGSTYENAANLAPTFIQKITAKYEGTRLGRQELGAELLLDTPGALWTLGVIERNRLRGALPSLRRIVVAIDPAVSVGEGSDETGIVVAAELWSQPGQPAKAIVLEDLTGRYLPGEWARVAVNAYHRWQGDCIVAEANNGGEMVRHTIQTIPHAPAVKLVHASRGKATRAEPISMLYDQDRVAHWMDGETGLAKLEEQMTTWVPGQKSPDRMDALVWGITELLVPTEPTQYDPYALAS
jgi:phage terminase large subunit-like protein